MKIGAIRQKVGSRLKRYSAAIALRNRRWWRVHLWFFERLYEREILAFSAGKAKFARDVDRPNMTSSFLRRSVHRIEKGLISRPRRPVFAADYIGKTVDVYANMLELEGSSGRAELAWARDVLSEYFDACQDCPSIREARQKFASLKNVETYKSAQRASKRAPYARNSPEIPVRYEALLELSMLRRSVRWFEDKPVPRTELLRALAIAAQSPSACNRQPFTFRVFDKEPHLSIAAGLPPGTRGYEHQFRCVIAVVGQQRYYSEERDRHLIYIDGSLATMSLILAFETLGLSSCCINWPDIEERELAAEKALQLEPDERIVMFIAVGYADPKGLIPYSEKRTPEELCRFNFE